MNNKKIVQVCFSLKNGLSMTELREKMLELKEKLNETYGADGFELRSCHLTRRLCIEKSLSTDVPDMFAEIFGENYVCELTEDTFAEAMANIDRHRIELSKKADKLVILAGETVTNVALELELFTKNRVMVL